MIKIKNANEYNEYNEQINNEVIELEQQKLNLLNEKKEKDLNFNKIKSEYVQLKIEIESKITKLNTLIAQKRRSFRIVGYNVRRKLTTKQKHNFIEKNGGKCSVCGKTEDLMVGHKIPLSLGGQNTDENKIVICKQCEKKNHRV